MKRIILSVAWCIGLAFFLLPSHVTADENVDTKTKIIYQINQDGTNSISHNIELTNLKSSSFVSEYITELNSNRLSDIKVTDNRNQPIPFQTQTTDTSTILQVKFTTPIVGKDKTQILNLTYQNPDVSQNIGNILEINIPKVANIADFSSYQASVIVPQQFGAPSHLSPQPLNQDEDTNFQRFHYDLIATNTGAQLLFGTVQYYHLTATIPLTNSSITPIETQFAIPPDTPYQQVFINQLNPQPLSLKSDTDGNWIVTYGLEAKETKTIQLDQTIAVYNQPQPHLMSQSKDLNQYLNSQEYWETQADSVTEFASQHQTASQIYQGIVDTFQYNYARIDNQSTHRLGAKQAFNDPDNSLCLEFTDSFIAAARHNNIPSRLLTGFAYTQNTSLKPLSLVENTLHAWPEYYQLDANTWHAIDPTWGKTTGGVDYFNSFDFNHIVFAINGLDSSSPQPLGYQTGAGQSLQVEFATQPPNKTNNVTVETSTPLSTLVGITNHLNLSITNQSNHAIHNQTATLSDGSGQLASLSIENSLPFSTTTHKLELDTNIFQINPQTNLNYYDQDYPITITRLPSYIGFIIFATTATIATFIALFAIRSRSLLVPGSKK